MNIRQRLPEQVRDLTTYTARVWLVHAPISDGLTTVPLFLYPSNRHGFYGIVEKVVCKEKFFAPRFGGGAVLVEKRGNLYFLNAENVL